MFAEHLAVALADLPELGATVQAGLAAHFALLLQWNARTNLTAITDPETAAWLHYRDCLEGRRFITAGSVVDLGSGGGFPGLVLAIADPALRLTLVEPKNKKVSFLKTAVATLGLENVTVRAARSTDTPPSAAQTVVTRATFSDPEDLIAGLAWVEAGGQLIAWRSTPSNGQAPTGVTHHLHRYLLRDEPRYLEVWTRPRRN